MALTAKQIAAGQRRTLNSIAKRLRDMAAQWGDVDTYNESALEDMAKDAELLADNLLEGEK